MTQEVRQVMNLLAFPKYLKQILRGSFLIWTIASGSQFLPSTCSSGHVSNKWPVTLSSDSSVFSYLFIAFRKFNHSLRHFSFGPEISKTSLKAHVHSVHPHHQQVTWVKISHARKCCCLGTMVLSDQGKEQGLLERTDRQIKSFTQFSFTCGCEFWTLNWFEAGGGNKMDLLFTAIRKIGIEGDIYSLHNH